MSDTYSTVPGQSNTPGLPPINLPSLDVPQDRPRLRITVGAQPQPQPPAPGPQAPAPAAPPWADYPDVEAGAPQAAAPSKKPWDDYPDIGTEEPKREVGTGEAVGRGLASGLTFGAAPAIQGLSEAAGETGRALQEQEAKTLEDNPAAGETAGGAAIAQPFIGAAKMIHNYFSAHPDPEVQEAYNRGREEGLKNERLAQEQHPAAFFGGVLAGTAMTPAFGAFRAAGLGGRIVQGVRSGGISGGLYGAGSAVSEGQSPADVAKSAAKGAAIGAGVGGALGGAVGPRAVGAAPTAGERAARTAEGLGAPLPRGVTSDSRSVQSTTSRLRQMPFAGSRIGERVDATQEAAGRRVGEIADTMTGGIADRAAADTVVRPGLENVVGINRQRIDAAYNGVRGQINQTQQFAMPRTDQALNAIMRERAAAGWADPAQGLDQFRRVAGGATFNGAHRARVDARNAGDVLNPHPGYNAADFNRLTRAMTQDLRDMVQTAATNQTQAGRSAAVRAFDQAETQFGRLAEENRDLQRLINSRGEGAIATLLGAAKEKGGNLGLLTRLRNTMDPQDFQMVGGMLLHELGHNNSTGLFSLAQFTTNLDKVSDRALGALFSRQHAQNIRDIAAMGQHIKGALRESSSSHSANLLVLLDVAKDAALLGGDIMSGGLGLGSAIGAGTTAGLWVLTKWLASPANSASMAAWSRAYGALTLGRPTPARTAAFNIATRNLGNTLGIPVEKILRSAGQRAEEQPEDETVQGPVESAPK